MKVLQLIIAISIGISTIGFTVLPYVFDDRIADNREVINSNYFNEDFVILHIEKANFAFFSAVVEKDHGDILKTLGNKGLSFEKHAMKIKNFRNSLIFAIKAAEIAGVISYKEHKNRIEKVKEISSYKEMFPKYMENLLLAQKGFIESRKRTADLRKQIKEIEKNKMNLWVVFIVLQTFGLVLSTFVIGCEKQ